MLSQNHKDQNKNNELDLLLEFASKGSWPLFETEWLKSVRTEENKKITLGMAKRIVNEGMKKLSVHRSVARKKIALECLNENERKVFTHSFIKLVEFKSLDELKELQ